MNDLERLVKYWNNAFSYDGTMEVNKEEYKNLAPSVKLYEAVAKLAKKNNILDYGTGHGWASIILSRENASNITAVDMAFNAIKMASNLALAYDAKNINFKVIDETFINEDKELYDGIVCSNVLDVIPLEVSKRILEYFNRVTTKDATIVIGLNYYLDLKDFKTNERTKIDPPYFYVDDVLRLTSKTDDEWIDFFSLYFKVEKLDYFAWPEEKEEKRRLFILSKK